MTLESLYYISQTVAVVAILGTLIALIVQTRQTQAQNQQAVEQGKQANMIARAKLSAMTTQLHLNVQSDMFGSEENAAFMFRALHDPAPLPPSDAYRFFVQMTNLLTGQEVAYRLHHEGLYLEDQLERIRKVNLAYFRSQNAREWWRVASDTVYIDPYRSWMQEIIDEAEAAVNERVTPEDKPE